MKRKQLLGNRIFMALVFVFLYAPIFILIIFSFNAGNSSAVWKGFSLKWYESLLSNRLIMNSVYTTLLVSLLSTIVASIAGTFAAIGLYAMSRRRRAAVNAVNNIPMMNADIVTGVSLCLLFVVFFNGWGAFAGWMNSWQSLVVLPERLTMGFGTLLIAHICFNIPYVILSVGPKLRQMDRNLIDAAQDLGCTWMQAFWRVVIPEIKPGIVSGALTAFTMSVDDFIISYFTAGTSSSTLAMTIYGMTKKRVSPEINAISTLLFVTVLVLLAVVNLRESRADHRLKAEHHAAPSAAHHPNRSKLHKTLRRVGAGLAACVLVVTLIVTGRSARSDRVVNVCSWGEYIDESLITQFEEETGIRVNYQTAESNEALYSLIKMGGADFDVIVPSDYMIARLIDEDMLAELETTLEGMDLGPLLGLWLQSSVIGLTMQIMGIIIFVLVYGRMIEIYLMTSLAPLPVATLSNRELGGTGQNYLKSLFAVGFQGMLILVCVAIYAVLIQGIATGGDPIGAIWGTVGYTVLLCFMLFKTGGIAQRIFGAH